MKVSLFNNVSDTNPKSFDLDEWLKNTIDPPQDLKDKVLKYRFLKSKRLKLKIPCVTISASFKKIRNLDNIKEINNLICLDIDRDSNPVADMNLVKEWISKHPSTLYAGFSVSNNGIYAIIKITKKKKLIKFFEFFRDTLLKKGIIIDESCKDYTRLRFFSYDPEAYYNPDAVEFNLPKKRKIKKSSAKGSATKSDQEKVEAVIKLIEDNGIDITSGYSDWVKIAGALFNAFGESGRDYFHRVSRFHHDYKVKSCDRKFTNCQNMKRVNLSSFFYVADSYGIRY